MFMTVLALEALVQGLDTIGVRRLPLARHLPRGNDVNPWDRIDLEPLRPAMSEIRSAGGPSVFLSAGLAVSSLDVPILKELFLADGSLSGAWRSIAVSDEKSRHSTNETVGAQRENRTLDLFITSPTRTEPNDLIDTLTVS